jgi:hypothetical protein
MQEGGLGDGGGPFGEAGPSALVVAITVTALGRAGLLPSGASVEAGVNVYDAQGGAVIRNATVMLGPPGGMQLATEGVAAPGLYARNYTGYSSGVDVSVQRGSDSLAVRLLMPQYFSIAMSPTSPIHGAGAELTWAPSGETDVSVAAQFTSSTTGGQVGPVSDNGMVALAPSTFPNAGSYSEMVTRSRSQKLGSPGSTANLEVDVGADLTVQ